ncbi:MAG: efflux RND transporter permease subunit, partial [Pseudomonadota bacterium]
APAPGHGLAGLSVRRPHLAAVMNLLIVVAGAAALFGVEVRRLPDVDRPIVSVRANFPGAAPETVDARLASPIEREVARVEGVLSVRTSSEEGNFRLRAEFSHTADINDAANDVRQAVTRATGALPDEVEDVRVTKSDADASPIMTLAVWSEDGPLTGRVSERVFEEVLPAISASNGVSDVTLFGGRSREVRVVLDPARLAARGLAVSDVADVLREAQFDAPLGSFQSGPLEVLVRADATVADPTLIERLALPGGVALGEVASVFFSLTEPNSVARLNGRDIIQIGVIRQAGASTVAVSNGVRAVLERLRLRHPDLRMVITRDQAVFIRGALEEVGAALVVAFLVVTGVIWLFIGRLGATLAPALAIPVSLGGALAAIWLLGFSLNLVTLLALVLAAGLVVDDAIVVLESIARRRAEGHGPRAAAVLGARRVFFAVIATTVTLVAVFLPISFTPSVAGRLFTEFGYVLSIAVVISSFVALTLVPMIASRLPDLGGARGRGMQAVGQALESGFSRALRPVLAAPLVALTIGACAAGAALLLWGELGQELTPREDRGEVTLRMQGPDGVGLEHTERQVLAAEAMLEPWIAAGVVENVYSITGRYDPNRGFVTAQLAPWETREVSQAEVEADLRPQMRAMIGASGRVQGGNSLGVRNRSGAGLALALTGATYPEIAEAAYAFADRLGRIEGVERVRVQYQATQPQLALKIDRARAADLGVELEAIAATLRALVEQENLTDLTVGDRAIPVRLRAAEGAVRGPQDLLNMTIRARDGAPTRLAQFVTVEEGPVAAELDRHAQRRAIEIDVTLTPELPLGDAVAATRALAAETLPDEIGLLFYGAAASLEETSAAVAATFVIAALVVFLVLVAQFESVTSAVVVMTVAPFALCAAMLALWLTGGTINLFSQIGALMLIGVMAKNGILLVEYAEQLRGEGRSPTQAAYEGAIARLRPIAMTLISTALAALPLILSEGPGAESRAAIGWVVFGGLGIAAAATLFLTPAAYALFAGFTAPRAAVGARVDEELAAGPAGERGAPAE